MTLSEDIHRAAAADPSGDPQTIAAKLIVKYKPAGLVSLLAQEIASEQRKLAALAEGDAFRSSLDERFRDTSERGTSAIADAPAFRKLFGTPFALGDGERVLWGSATVEQHAQRIAYLEKLRDGLNQTIERHREAIRLIVGAGVSCLEEVGIEPEIQAA